ncbi:MAG TPA: VWA domain-containing protein [Thermoanaerobaculia bacterium]|jgi:VWFA-related protein|nr:VWA domain-containing protein [Thermoanaerobaculia bacterium]
MKQYFAALFIAAAVPIFPQQPKQQATAPYVETFDVQVNNVDVVVADRRGKPVGGLRREDFVVLEDGAPQPLSNFSEYSASASARTDIASANGDSALAPSSRKFVFVIDEMSLHPVTRRTMHRQLDEFVARMMRDGDEAMVVTPDARDTQIRLHFTGNGELVRRTLAAAIEKNRFRADTAFVREQLFSNQDDLPNDVRAVTGAAGRHYADLVSLRVWKTLGHLHSIVSALAEVPGKKTVIVLTESLPAIAGSDVLGMFGTFVGDYRLPLLWGREIHDLRPMLTDIAQTASSNGIAIYCLQPEYGFSGAAPGGDIGHYGQQNVNVSYRGFYAQLDATQASLEILTGRTGGRWMRGESRVDNFFDGLVSDLSAYYSLGYHPTSAVHDKARRIEVRLKGHPELSVRARRDVVRKSPGEEMNDLVVASLLYPKTVDELSVATTAGTPRREHGAWVVPVEVRVPIGSLTLLPDGETYRGSFSVHYAAAAEQGDFSAGVDRSQVIEVPAAEMAKARGQYYTYTTNLRVPPGRVNIAVGVLDPVSRLSSFKTLQVIAR